jgi:chromatin assembly factor 1 subunit B
MWSPDGLYLATTSIDHVVRLWDIRKSRCVKEIKEHHHYVQGVAWDPLGVYLATASSDG